MRLLDTWTGQFVDKEPKETEYAILSHTWDNVEQSYQDVRFIQSSAITSIWSDPRPSPKIRDSCRVAREAGHRYFWIDSCCIDKTSSSELTESINSMYKWYGLAEVCYAYLADVPSGEDPRADQSAFRESRWHKRGWTLQELIAPFYVVFLAEDWTPIGTKLALVDLVEEITGIPEGALIHSKSLDEFSVAQRLSWAAERETTREEDRAYSLLGIFNINMPTLYGEGARAFRRLQEEILRRIPDLSLLAW
ncbi:heterokaryon incompatibility protein-domain-containing protein, partial [Dichomitus squalens]